MHDKKVRKSRTALKQALIALMKKKPYSKITVKELCEEADLNRSTFYANYTGIQALLLNIYTDIFDEMSPALIETYLRFQVSTAEERIESVTEIIAYLQNNQDIFLPLLHNESDLFKKSLCEYYLERYALKHEDFHKRYILLYHVIGSCTLVYQWLSDHCPCTPQELAQIICKQSDYITQLTGVFGRE